MQLQNSSSNLNEHKTQKSPLVLIQNWLVDKIAQNLSLAPESINISEPLTRYGLDSIDAVTMVGDLEDWLATELPDTLFWDYPTIAKAAQYMVEECDISAAITSNNAEAETMEYKPKEPEKATAGKGWGGLFGRRGS